VNFLLKIFESVEVLYNLSLKLQTKICLHYI